MKIWQACESTLQQQGRVLLNVTLALVKRNALIIFATWNTLPRKPIWLLFDYRRMNL